MFRGGNRVSTLTAIWTPGPGLNPGPGPAAAAGAGPQDNPEPGGLVLSSEHRGWGRGLRGEARIRAGFEAGGRRDWLKVACGG